jgi:hypothetical protein
MGMVYLRDVELRREGRGVMAGQEPMPGIDPGAAMTALAEGMTQLHEVFRSAVEAGFSEEQAMQFILEIFRSTAREGGAS